VKKEQAYHAHDSRHPASNEPSNNDYCTDPGSEEEDLSRRLTLSRQSNNSYANDNYAVSITPTSCKSAKRNPPATKKKRTIHMLDESEDNGNNRSNKTSKSKDPLHLLDSN
jgi:hypothetical protein